VNPTKPIKIVDADFVTIVAIRLTTKGSFGMGLVVGGIGVDGLQESVS